MRALEIGLAVLAIALAIIPILSYAVARFYYTPGVVLRVSGQQNGGPIPLPSSNDVVWLGVSTEKNANVLIKEIWVKHQANELELTSAVGRTVTGFGGIEFPGEEGSIISTFDRDFPVALRFIGSWLVARRYFKLFPFGYKAKDGVQSFGVEVLVYAKIDDADIGFPWDMVGTKTYKHQWSLKFNVEKFAGSSDEKLKRYGFRLGPGEAMMAGYTIKKGNE